MYPLFVRRAIGACAVSLLLVSTAQAVETSAVSSAASSAGLAAEPLTLREALRRAALSHPDLQGFAAEREGLAAGKALAGRSPTPEVGLLLEDAFGTGKRKALDGAQWTLSFTQALEIGEQRVGRIALAEARVDALSAAQVQKRRDAYAEVAQRFIEAAADDQRRLLAEEQVELAQKAFEAAQARVRAARAPLAEQSRARAALAQATLEREHAEHEELSARVALAVSLGLPEPDFGALQAQLFELPPVRPLDELRERLKQSPGAQARLAEAAVLEAERRAALASAGLKPTFTGGLRRYDAGNDDLSLVVGVSVPLFARRKAGDEAAIASAQLAKSEAENRAALLRAEELLYDRYQELGHAREALRLLDTEVLPARDEALAQTQYAFERGRYGYQELSLALQERASAQRERLDTAAHYHSLLAELERLTGERLIEGSQP